MLRQRQSQSAQHTDKNHVDGSDFGIIVHHDSNQFYASGTKTPYVRMGIVKLLSIIRVEGTTKKHAMLSVTVAYP